MSFSTSGGAIRLAYRAFDTHVDLSIQPDGYYYLCCRQNGNWDDPENGLFMLAGGVVHRVEWQGAGFHVWVGNDSGNDDKNDGFYVLPDATGITWGTDPVDMSTARFGGFR